MSLPIITPAEMREWEHVTWEAGVTEASVIERVGKQVAELALRLTAPGSYIVILAGKGHNGDDARAAEKFLADHRYTRWNITDPSEVMESLPADLAKCDLIIDGLFGIGFNRPLNEEWQKLVELINASQVPVLSIDAPSGLNVDTGEVQGTAIRATVTLTVGTPKHGLLSQQAQEYVGRLEVASDVGLAPCPIKSDLTWIEADDFKRFPPPRHVNSHKGTYGHVTIFAGSQGYHGAAVLAAKGAMRAQPGLVTLFTPENVYVPVASQLQAAMVHPWVGNPKIPKSTSAILFGPGLADPEFPVNLRNQLRTLWAESALPVVADASALDWLSGCQVKSDAIRLMTPHPGEAAWLLAMPSEAVQKDRSSSLRLLASRYRCWVILKGHHTLIGRGGGEISVNSTGNPYLAQGGSGDILAGFLSGLLAQPRLQADPMKTVSYGVWRHGAAADELSRSMPNWTTEDLVTFI